MTGYFQKHDQLGDNCIPEKPTPAWKRKAAFPELPVQLTGSSFQESSLPTTPSCICDLRKGFCVSCKSGEFLDLMSPHFLFIFQMGVFQTRGHNYRPRKSAAYGLCGRSACSPKSTYSRRNCSVGIQEATAGGLFCRFLEAATRQETFGSI